MTKMMGGMTAGQLKQSMKAMGKVINALAHWNATILIVFGLQDMTDEQAEQALKQMKNMKPEHMQKMMKVSQ